MAISKQVENNNLLNAWPRVMNEMPFIFNQATGSGAPLTKNCHVYIQPEREDIARALDASIKKMARVLHYWPRPKWFVDTLPISRTSVWGQIWKTQSGKLIEFGQRGATLIEADTTVTYSKSPAGATADNLATITVPTSVTDPAEIQLFFRVVDGAPEAGDLRYQIEPIQVSISGGQATITADRALFVKPNTIWDVPFQLDDPNFTTRNYANTGQSTDFVEKVDVYRVFNDPTTQIEVLDGNNVSLGAYDAVIVDATLGLFEFSQSCCSFIQSCGYAARVRVNYRAGEALTYGQMDSEFEDAIIRLSSVLMPNELCAFCTRAKDRWEQDRSPLIVENTAVLTANDVNNEFGSVLQGAVWAYRVALDRAIQTGGKLTRNWR